MNKFKVILGIVAGAACGYFVVHALACTLWQLGLCGTLAVIVGVPMGGVLGRALAVPRPKAREPRQSGILGAVLRSLTPVTCALAGGYAVVMPVLAALSYEFKYGRPSSTAALAIPFGVMLGIGAAAVGGLVGVWIANRVRGSRWAGPIDLRAAVAVVAIILTVPTVFAVAGARRAERAKAPRVIFSSGEIVRAKGPSILTPVTGGTFLWVNFPHPDHPTGELRWNGRLLQVSITGQDGLRVAADDVVLQVPIGAFDHAREVYGGTAVLTDGGREYLALLVHLRATSRRNLLLIVDPAGTLVHQEVLDASYGPRVGLSIAGLPLTGQEIVIERGTPLRYARRD